MCSDRTNPVVTSMVQRLMAGLSLRESGKKLRVCLLFSWLRLEL